MPKSTTKKKGRPKINIDFKALDGLCKLQCTLVEIADYFNCSEDTIENRIKQEKGMLFSEYFKKKSSGGKISLRRMQFKTAEKGNPAMQIWLGKQYLGQVDKQEIEQKVKEDKEDLSKWSDDDLRAMAELKSKYNKNEV